MGPEWTVLLGWVVVAGLSGFILMGIDKARAVEGGWRIPEMTFFTLALVGGAFGILLGSSVFRHKTLKALFMGVIFLCTVLWLGILLAVVEAIGLPFG